MPWLEIDDEKQWQEPVFLHLPTLLSVLAVTRPFLLRLRLFLAIAPFVCR